MAAVSTGIPPRAASSGACRDITRGAWERAEVPTPSIDSGTHHEPDQMPDSQAGKCQRIKQVTKQPPCLGQKACHDKSSNSYTQPALSSVIPVPKHRLDEAIAAAALTSLSSGPLVLGVERVLPDFHNEPYGDNAATSSSCSSNNSCDLNMGTSIPSTPSPPLPLAQTLAQFEANIEDSDTTHFLFGDPVPRKRKNSGRLMFRCLWKNCGKVLSTSSAIQKHIRAIHLGRGAEQEHNDGEEDFYYTEIDVNIDTLSDGLSSLTPTSPTTAGPPSFPFAVSLGAANGTELPLVSPLSLSAPSTLCHVHTDHAYQVGMSSRLFLPQGFFGMSSLSMSSPKAQALSPVTVSATSKVGFSWQSPPLLIKAPPVHPGLGINEKRPPLLTTASNPKPGSGARKPRGEAKKCRKVYGMERRDMWCTACRWKKACQRFID